MEEQEKKLKLLKDFVIFPDSKHKIVKCPYCREVFTYFRALDSHVRIEHPDLEYPLKGWNPSRR